MVFVTVNSRLYDNIPCEFHINFTIHQNTTAEQKTCLKYSLEKNLRTLDKQ